MDSPGSEAIHFDGEDLNLMTIYQIEKHMRSSGLQNCRSCPIRQNPNMNGIVRVSVRVPNDSCHAREIYMDGVVRLLVLPIGPWSEKTAPLLGHGVVFR
jgi:hypothetical protein